MVDVYEDIASKVIAGCLTTLVLALAAFLGGRIKWVFITTSENQKDLNAAFKKIRTLEGKIDGK